MSTSNSMAQVSICMVTYNHEKWIAQAIESVLMQKIDFDYELLIFNDCSTDNTAVIIDHYKNAHSEKIKVTHRAKNLGLERNFSDALNQCNGKYIAILEGDDYWSDPEKLQRQYEILENDPSIVLCSHNATHRLEDAGGKLENNFKYKHSFRFDQEANLRNWATQPLTCFFRNIIEDYKTLHRDNIFCDVIIFYELLKYGQGLFLPEDMAVFRVHKTAKSSGQTQEQWYMNHILMYDSLRRNNPADKILPDLIFFYYKLLYVNSLRNGFSGTEYLEKMKKDYPNYKILLKFFLVERPYYLTKKILNKL